MHIHDSLSNALRLVSPQNVSIYACGITPYSDAHVGHARTYIVFDQLSKVLQAQGHNVRLVRNITDIDDKIIDAARREGSDWASVSARYANRNRSLMKATGLGIPEEPKASDYIADIVIIIEKLLALQLAYVSPTGDVLYRVASYRGHLLMNHQPGSSLSERGRARVDTQGKEDVRDFALWKKTPPLEPGFESPWGRGRPGWHIECSAMIGAMFQGHVTIHGGGVDLKFPHHQSEIMQSEPVFGIPVADLWMHNGSVLSNGIKMSKSLGNVVGWEQALQMAHARAPGLGGDILRYAMLGTHWSQPLDWTNGLIEKAANELELLIQRAHANKFQRAEHTFAEQLQENFNTPRALGWLHLMGRKGNGATVVEGLALMGIDTDAWEKFKRNKATISSTLSAIEVEEFLQRREEARVQKDWKTSDAIRLILRSHGLEVQDKK